MKNRELNELIPYIQQNIKIGTYTPLNKMESKTIRSYYLEKFNDYFNSNHIDTNKIILDKNTELIIANGYNRVVIGDYGLYLEISSSQIEFDNLYIKRDQEWRLNSKKFKNIKYYWYEVAENSAKIYYQINLVKYADYRIGYYYVSPYEITLEEKDV